MVSAFCTRSSAPPNGPADAARLIDPLRAALDGTGPAILPLDARLRRRPCRCLLDTFAPDEVDEPADGDVGAPSGRQGCAAGHGGHRGTSGSTGRPKGVELSATALLHSAQASLARIGAPPGERWLCCLPVTHVAGLQVLVRSLAAGTEPVVAVADGERWRCAGPPCRSARVAGARRSYVGCPATGRGRSLPELDHPAGRGRGGRGAAGRGAGGRGAGGDHLRDVARPAADAFTTGFRWTVFRCARAPTGGWGSTGRCFSTGTTGSRHAPVLAGEPADSSLPTLGMSITAGAWSGQRTRRRRH